MGLDKLEHGLAYAFLMLWFAQIYIQKSTRWTLAFFLSSRA
jgi:hypothetical protein